MNLYKISQNVVRGYDTYDSAVVAAENEERARNTHPGFGLHWSGAGTDEWPAPTDVKVVLIGYAAPFTRAGVIVASFNAG